MDITDWFLYGKQRELERDAEQARSSLAKLSSEHTSLEEGVKDDTTRIYRIITYLRNTVVDLEKRVSMLENALEKAGIEIPVPEIPEPDSTPLFEEKFPDIPDISLEERKQKISSVYSSWTMKDVDG
jgi:hypothetical protein